MDPDTTPIPPPPELASTAEKRSSEAENGEPAAKRVRLDGDSDENGRDSSVKEDAANGQQHINPAASEIKPDNRVKGQAPIKAEYLVEVIHKNGRDARDEGPDDDAAEGRTASEPSGKVARKGKKGQNQARDFGRSADTIRLCNSRMLSDEFSPKHCSFGDRCNLSHDLRKYLAEGRRPDLETFGGKCPIFKVYGWCNAGWKCLFVRSHMEEVEREDGRKELVLLRDLARSNKPEGDGSSDDKPYGVVNTVASVDKHRMGRSKVDLSKSVEYSKWMDQYTNLVKQLHNARIDEKKREEELGELRATFVEPPFKPSEKRRLYFGRETPVLAPLTTQGNLPFRRLCVDLGAQGTYSEMAMAKPIVQGQQSEWALMKAHESEIQPPTLSPATLAMNSPIVKAYDNSRDLRFGAQISASSHPLAIKAAECLTTFLPHLRLIDLNCGCPIDMIYKAGAGSALLEQHNKIERIIRGMNAVSGEVPITCKLRIGVKENHPLAMKNIERAVFGSPDFRDQLGAPGCAAITLHGRTRQQRYKKPADWGYIAECAALIQSYRDKRDELTDTAREPDASTLAPSSEVFFLGNGDCYSHADYYKAIDESRVDTVMIGRGALIKPWVFEEIAAGQYLDKSSTERLGYIERFCRYGMEAWGADEMGIGTTRRFLLEYLSFAYRYVPIGLLERLPPAINDRPPAYRGRDDLETLMASDNYRDWIKISEMFLGPAHEGFKFQPKHKSNSYEMEAEG
ncbi:hypothetical protein PspLS_04400 [Pyricularia sp. CBS 133598]|nr:hypothetical protein PspLS_04400 [Pyricularia sp. CBS 133598]